MAITGITGTGSTISHSGWSGEILGITKDGRTIGQEEMSKMSTTEAKEFLAHDLEDPGKVTIEVEYVGTAPTLGGANSNLVITLSNGVTITTSANIESESFAIVLEGKCTSSLTFQLSGTTSYG